MNIINSNQTISKIRPNLWQLDTGHVVGFGTILAPDGLYFCFTCSADNCPHVETVSEAWVAGEDSAEIPWNGSVPNARPSRLWAVRADALAIAFDDDELTFVSGAGMFAEYDYGLSEPWL